MGKTLIIVESPAKIKTIKKFLGANFELASSVGHIRDLPQKEFGIDFENDFEPTYVTMPDKQKVIDDLKRKAKGCDLVCIAPDPDREGEAIAWHIAHILPKNVPIQRVSFNSITKEAVLSALSNPREIDYSLVNAQQARRLLDRIVGYKISPILNRKMQRGRNSSVSAGRVQSVALMLVVQREALIEAFIPVEYWNISGIFLSEKKEKTFSAYLHSVDGKKVEKEPVPNKDVQLISNKETADSIVARLNTAEFQITKVVKKEKKRNPVPPFITSTIQQEASRHYRFSSSRTMRIAQGLYEGIDLGNEGAEGIITYMRTDSVRNSPESIAEAREFIEKTFGKEYLPAKANAYSSKKSAQDAHEAIRPTNMAHSPESIESYLTKEQFQLYSLIWKRFIASQMNPAIYDTVSADIMTEDNILLRATGSVLKFPGFLAVYEEKQDEEKASTALKLLPPLEEGKQIQLQEILSEQSFTKPPPRFSEASLVKELEKSGIGRPSTYASIMGKIQSREYTIKEQNRLIPTELGTVVTALLSNYFQEIMNRKFTSDMEDSLELVAESKKDWKDLLKDFWVTFEPTVKKAAEEAMVPKILTDIDCPTCKAKLNKVWYKDKYFYGCSKYPECSYSSPIEELSFNKDEYAENFDWEQKCPKCSKDMKVRHGRYGAFLGCTTYPECKGIVNIPRKGEEILLETDMPKCPAIDCPGNMVARRSRFGKIFFSCTTYPDCNVIINDLEKLPEKYPNHPRTPYVKKTKAKKGKTAKDKGKTTKGKKGAKKTAAKEKKPRKTIPLKLSPALVAVVNDTILPREQVLKKIWEYIHAHNLQDPTNKRLIVPDEKLAAVFGQKEPLPMQKIMGVIGPHVEKIEEKPEE